MAGSRGAFGLAPAAAFCAVLCIVAFACLPQLAHAASQGVDVFGRPLAPAAASGASAPASSTSAAGSATVFGTVTPPVEQKPAFVLPEPVRKVLFAAIVWQGRLNARIEDAASQLRRHDGNAVEWLTLLLMSFGYGVLHAVGPGHGKLVVGTWLGSRNARIAHAVMLSGWTATVQALSAIVLVVGAVWLANAGAGGVLAQAESLEIVSYALLCIAGGWTLWNSLMRRDCCFDPTAVELVPRSTKAVREDEALDAPDTGASLASSSSYLGTKLNPRTRESRGGPLARWSSRRLSRGPSRAVAVGQDTVSPWSQLLATGFAAGVRPCAGAIFVLVASIGAHVPSIGIAATFAMAAGVALTVTLVGLGSVGANRLLVTRSLRYRSRVRNAQRAVAIAGGALIVLFAAAQLALLIGGYIEPTLT